MKRWYVAHTQPNGEKRALFHLARQGFTAYLPQYLKRRRHARKTDWVPAPYFPRYLFVGLDVERDRWLAVRSTVGVSGLISNGELPLAVPDGIVESIQEYEDARGFLIPSRRARFRSGDSVQIIEGALADQVGIFDCNDGNERVFVLLNLLGREVRVRLPLEAIAAFA